MSRLAQAQSYARRGHGTHPLRKCLAAGQRQRRASKTDRVARSMSQRHAATRDVSAFSVGPTRSLKETNPRQATPRSRSYLAPGQGRALREASRHHRLFSLGCGPKARHARPYSPPPPTGRALSSRFASRRPSLTRHWTGCDQRPILGGFALGDVFSALAQRWRSGGRRERHTSYEGAILLAAFVWFEGWRWTWTPMCPTQAQPHAPLGRTVHVSTSDSAPDLSRVPLPATAAASNDRPWREKAIGEVAGGPASPDAKRDERPMRNRRSRNSKRHVVP